MNTEPEKEYIYIAKFTNEQAACKIGKSKDLERRLKEYQTGNSIDNVFKYLFCCEVTDMKIMEGDIMKHFARLRQKANIEMFFYNDHLLEDYINFIKEHPLFIKEIFLKPDSKPQIEKITKIIQRDKPTMKERDMTYKKIMLRAQRLKNDEFYTRYEDVEKELSMYDKKI